MVRLSTWGDVERRDDVVFLNKVSPATISEGMAVSFVGNVGRLGNHQVCST